ncbi:hypothetical protein JS278_03142 [Acidipropionibacterium virtanenii]|uniref:DUF3817 domain-containing protein n=2 Tax=Acidipropionibacterium virtanenii TaxID=2057246 RepID=A0A344UYC8_9ACTN|nr:hypothetical protein JS278_03142 [Acidipropionibacterium virtanenii]
MDDVTSDDFYDDPGAASRQPLGPPPAGDADPEEPWIAPEEIASVRGALLRYRVMAYVVGTLLIVLVCVAMPLKYAADMPQMVNVVGVAHGWLYALLLVTAYMLGRKAGWPLTRLLLIALAGTVPFLSFVAEHYARKDVHRRIAETQEYYGTGA